MPTRRNGPVSSNVRRHTISAHRLVTLPSVPRAILDNMNNNQEAPIGDFAQRHAEGKATISKLWPRLQLSTRSWLMTPDGNGQKHFDSRGRNLGAEDQFGDIACVEYALGTMLFAVKAPLPSKGTDVIPALLDGNEIIEQVAELVYWPAGRDPEFAAMGLHALLKQRTSLALQLVYLTGGSIEEPKFLIARVGARIVTTLLFVLTLPLALGYGLSLAFKDEGFGASLCAYWGLYAVWYLIDANKTEVKKEVESYRRWQELCTIDFHIGTGHGLEVKLTEMLRAGIKIPSVLFDLCAMVRSRAGPFNHPAIPENLNGDAK